MREFREKVAIVSATTKALQARVSFEGDESRGKKRMAEITDLLNPAYHAIRLLVAEKGADHTNFLLAMDRFVHPSRDEGAAREFAAAAEDILRRERDAIEADPGVWRVLWTSLGLDAVKWRP
jgi:hypothetical protein